jgi:hypothetical protein
MEDLFIQGTESLPTISFKANGELKITGRALPEDANKFFIPVFQWAEIFSSDEINIEINLDYFNTSVSKQLLDFFKILEKNPANKMINLKWMYEDGDEEMLESGEIFQDILPRFRFTFHKYAEMGNL